MRLRIETDTELTEYISNIEVNLRQVKKLANKIVMEINHVDVAILKNRGVESKYIYTVDYIQRSDFGFKCKEITDKERIERLEKEVATLMSDKCIEALGREYKEEYFIQEHSFIKEVGTGKGLGYMDTKKFPFFTIEGSGYYGSEDECEYDILIKNVVTGKIYKCNKEVLGLREDYQLWQISHEDFCAKLRTYGSRYTYSRCR